MIDIRYIHLYHFEFFCGNVIGIRFGIYPLFRAESEPCVVRVPIFFAVAYIKGYSLPFGFTFYNVVGGTRVFYTVINEIAVPRNIDIISAGEATETNVEFFRTFIPDIESYNAA